MLKSKVSSIKTCVIKITAVPVVQVVIGSRYSIEAEQFPCAVTHASKLSG